jgi:hypothetical protein
MLHTRHTIFAIPTARVTPTSHHLFYPHSPCYTSVTPFLLYPLPVLHQRHTTCSIPTPHVTQGSHHFCHPHCPCYTNVTPLELSPLPVLHKRHTIFAIPLPVLHKRHTTCAIPTPRITQTSYHLSYPHCPCYTNVTPLQARLTSGWM